MGQSYSTSHAPRRSHPNRDGQRPRPHSMIIPTSTARPTQTELTDADEQADLNTDDTTAPAQPGGTRPISKLADFTRRRASRLIRPRTIHEGSFADAQSYPIHDDTTPTTSSPRTSKRRFSRLGNLFGINRNSQSMSSSVAGSHSGTPDALTSTVTSPRNTVVEEGDSIPQPVTSPVNQQYDAREAAMIGQESTEQTLSSRERFPLFSEPPVAPPPVTPVDMDSTAHDDTFWVGANGASARVSEDATVSPSQPEMASEPPFPDHVENMRHYTSPETNQQPFPVAPNAMIPPAGTMMVVQGVVHTADPPPTLNPQARSTRDRVMSLLPSPAYPRRSHRARSLPPNPSTTVPQPTPHPPTSLFASSSQVNAPSEPPMGTDETGEGQQNIEDPSAQLSPSSIDVLGTLLSVATAATAASLVTGSTDPLFSSGLAGSPPASNDRTRTRTAWDSLRDTLRDRLGLSPRREPEQVDATQNMFSEMARALMERSGSEGSAEVPPSPSTDNLSETHNPPTVSPDIPATTIAPVASLAGPGMVLTPAPEASMSHGHMRQHQSFEGFLRSLQVELREALMDERNGRHDASTQPLTPAAVPPLGPEPLSEPPSLNPGIPDPPELDQNVPPPERGRLNWSRVYRFPPMRLGPAQQNDESAPPAPSNQDHAGTAQSNPPLRIVVPVIVVGLRSRPQTTTEPSPPEPPAETPDPPPEPTQPMSNNTNRAEQNLRDDPRPGWSSRAARAIGRIGRRTADRPATSGSPQPPRPTLNSYVIWVIGGYYPLEHPWVTGADADISRVLDALWDLADLFAPRAPVVATAADIAKSGLSIFKGAELPEYERQGRVASNTTEQCLICLQEYEPEDDLRLLNCRHVYHKDCVDHWLEFGKNNCPTCRGEGVPLAQQDIGATPPPQNDETMFTPT